MQAHGSCDLKEWRCSGLGAWKDGGGDARVWRKVGGFRRGGRPGVRGRCRSMLPWEGLPEVDLGQMIVHMLGS